MKRAEEDIKRLTKEGVDGFQIDSIYFESIPGVKKTADTFTPYQDPSDVPQNVTDLWKDYDARKEALDVQVVKEWKSEGVITRYITFTVGTFKGTKSRIAAYYSFPDNGKRNAAFVWSHGGGQRAERSRGVYFAKQGFATLDINWLGRPMEEGIDLNTDWGKVDPTQGPRFYAKALRKGWKRRLQPDDYSIDPIVSPRNANWFLLTVAARRAITFLERQAEVDADKIGFSGYSMGGMVTALTAIDSRLKAVVPMVGGTGFKYLDFPGGLQGTSIRTHFKDDLELYQNTIDASGYWPLVNCPALFLSSSNDFHATFERIYQSMDLLEHSNWRISTNIHQNHGPGPEQWVLLNQWFDQHLNGIDQDIPVTPPSTLTVEGNQARLTVTPEDQDRLIGTEVYFSYDPNSRTRFWTRADTLRTGQSWETSLPVHDRLPLYTFALCHYRLPENVALQRGETSSFALNSLEHAIVPVTVDLQRLSQLENSRAVFEDFKNGTQDWSSRDGRTIKTYKFQSPDLDVSNNKKLRLTINPKGKSLTVRLNIESKFLGSGNDQGSFSFVKAIEGDDVQEIVIDREAFKPKDANTAATLEWSKIATFEVTIVDKATQTKLDLTSKQGHKILKRIDLID